MSLINIKKTISIMALVALTGSQCHAALGANMSRHLAARPNHPIVAAHPTTIHEQFRQAAMEGNTELTRELLERGADFKSTDKAGKTALNLAVEHHHADTVEFLLSRGAGYQPKSLQVLAARAANRKLKEDAQSAGEATVSEARLNDANLSQTGITLYLMEDLIQQANGNLSEALLKAIKSSISNKPQDSSPEVIEQIKKQSRDIVRRILIEYKDQLKTDTYRQAFTNANDINDPQIVSLLLGAQACPNDGVLETAVHLGHTEIVTILLNHFKQKCLDTHYAVGETINENALQAKLAAHVNKAYVNNRTLLIIATECHRPEIVRILLDAGADIDKPSQTNQTALMCAAHTCDNEIMSILLDAKADVFPITRYGESALSHAARWGNIEQIKQLLSILASKKENAAALRLQYCTALSEAIEKNRSNYSDTIHMLLQAAKQTPQINDIIQHAFTCAFTYGTIQTAHLFLDAAIERRSCRPFDLTSIACPVNREHATAVDQLCQKAGLDIAGDAGTRALLSATTQEKFKTVCLLLDAGAQLPRTVDQNGDSMLICVVRPPANVDTIAPDDRITLTRMLLHAGAAAPDYINMAAADGKTALKIALQYAIELKKRSQPLTVEELEAKKELEVGSEFYMEKPELIEEQVLIQKKLITEQLLIIDELLRAGAIVDDETRADIEQLEPEFRQYIGS